MAPESDPDILLFMDRWTMTDHDRQITINANACRQSDCARQRSITDGKTKWRPLSYWPSNSNWCCGANGRQGCRHVNWGHVITIEDEWPGSDKKDISLIGLNASNKIDSDNDAVIKATQAHIANKVAYKCVMLSINEMRFYVGSACLISFESAT